MSERRRYMLWNDRDRFFAQRAIKDAPQGYYVEIKPPTRSLEQNARLWAMLTDVSEQVVWYGQKLTPDDWKDVFTASLRKARVVPTIEGDGFVPLGMRTSQMTVGEMADLQTLIEAFGAERGVKFKDEQRQKHRDIAERFGISSSNVHCIANKKSWAHL